jgi:acetyl esterase/lipase
MFIEKIHPQLRDTFRKFPTLPLHNKQFVSLCKLVMPIAPTPKAGPGIAIDTRKLKNASVRIYRPHGELSGAGLLWIHGGGLVVGGAKQDDRLCGAMARDLGIVIVSVDYRLAPEHQYPCAIDDCFEAWEWLRITAPNLGIEASRIAIAGQSAGGGLAAALALRILDAGGVQPAAQLLFCPMLDDRTATRRELDDIKYPLWTNRSNRQAWTWYLGQPAGSASVSPYAAPARRENLAGLPPTWISIGDIELFYDEAVLYAERLKETGVRLVLHVTPQAPHAFESIVPDAVVTRELVLSAYGFLGDSLGLPSEQKRFSYGGKENPNEVFL